MARRCELPAGSRASDLHRFDDGIAGDRRVEQFLSCSNERQVKTATAVVGAVLPEVVPRAVELPGRPAGGRFRLVDLVRSTVGARRPFRAARCAALPGGRDLPITTSDVLRSRLRRNAFALRRRSTKRAQPGSRLGHFPRTRFQLSSAATGSELVLREAVTEAAGSRKQQSQGFSRGLTG
jgi:hypothetical protein